MGRVQTSGIIRMERQTLRMVLLAGSPLVAVADKFPPREEAGELRLAPFVRKTARTRSCPPGDRQFARSLGEVFAGQSGLQDPNLSC